MGKQNNKKSVKEFFSDAELENSNDIVNAGNTELPVPPLAVAPAKKTRKAKKSKIDDDDTEALSGAVNLRQFNNQVGLDIETKVANLLERTVLAIEKFTDLAMQTNWCTNQVTILIENHNNLVNQTQKMSLLLRDIDNKLKNTNNAVVIPFNGEINEKASEDSNKKRVETISNKEVTTSKESSNSQKSQFDIF
jgi:hypothetical protein